VSGQAKKAPKPSERSALRVGRASVSWGPQPYGKPGIVASAPLEAIDDLVVAVAEARERIRTVAQSERQPGPYELSERVDQELYREFRTRNREAGIQHDGDPS
jgi:hypothetical protein